MANQAQGTDQTGAQASTLPDFVLRQFDQHSPQNDHRQLYSILQGGIRQQVLAAGTKLPPTRVLAQALAIARNTVVHVYEQLALEGYVQAGVGRGTYVAAIGPRLVDRSAAPPAASGARTALLSRRGSQLVREATGSTPTVNAAFVHRQFATLRRIDIASNMGQPNE
ncbi:GntR family transcriptional regulator [Hydrogenophaga sp. A37]|uniref:GntR family transcriptional regulator n=1 Tax=Hydrogenophaga sp. A37 TaxID=1945864 RepID=UPI000984B326|nr:GntR family transcriptional regulator [Hydrogenophaga sp. A37]OOG79512.1 hypothetical protein B0E41_23485 [Hydrogenophaga sp. A37]